MKKLFPVFGLILAAGLFFGIQSFAIQKDNLLAQTEVSAELPVDPVKKKACTPAEKKACKKTCTPAEKAACSKGKTANANTIVAGAKDVASDVAMEGAAKKQCSSAEKAACKKRKTAKETVEKEN